MPEEYAERLAGSKIVTVNHLLPMVMHKMNWAERDQTIILTGTRGEVPLMHRALKKPLQDAVPPGTMVLGYQVHTQQQLKKGDQVTLLGKEFTVNELHPQRGTADDSTVWINLSEAQELLKRQNLVNAILALECNCAAPDRIGQIRQEIAEILPGTQVIERGRPALARAEARNKAKQVAVSSMKQHESFAAVLVPLVVVTSAVWIGFLTFSNVRQRHEEIGILRAIGFRSTQILRIFLGKALFVGLLGAAIGYTAGFLLGAAYGDSLSSASLATLFAPELLLLAIVIAPLLSALASWLPAMLAARQDPALVLQGD
jgi:ABC-type lipoprotein release transport system permease subunit